jgi:hypothetical protein
MNSILGQHHGFRLGFSVLRVLAVGMLGLALVTIGLSSGFPDTICDILHLRRVAFVGTGWPTPVSSDEGGRWIVLTDSALGCMRVDVIDTSEADPLHGVAFDIAKKERIPSWATLPGKSTPTSYAVSAGWGWPMPWLIEHGYPYSLGQAPALPYLMRDRFALIGGVFDSPGWGTRTWSVWCPGMIADILVLGVAIRTATWFGCRARGEYRARRLRCVYCGYDLRGSVAGRCPECGAELKPRHATRLANSTAPPLNV